VILVVLLRLLLFFTSLISVFGDQVKFVAAYFYSQYPLLSSSTTPSAAFAKAMERYGFKGVKPVDIVNTGKQIREEIGKTDQVRAAIL
jgi:hypothetical protein